MSPSKATTDSPDQSQNGSPLRRVGMSPKRLLLDTPLSMNEETVAMLTPLRSSPRGSPRSAMGSSALFYRRAPFMLCMALSCCLLLMEFSFWQKGTGSFLFSTVTPCDNTGDASFANQEYMNDIKSTKDNRTDLDFAIVGFPKTGTTFLIYALEQHPQVLMPPQETWTAPMEFCQIHHQDGAQQLRDWLHNTSSIEVAGSLTKRGIKCPTMVRATNAIEHLMAVSDVTKLVVGVRHPVSWFQSFYNYRVSENKEFPEQYPEPIPSPFTLINRKEWRDVSMAYAKFDKYLKQLMKVPLSGKDLKDLLATDAFWEKRATPNPYKVFIYTNEQLNDKNVTRQASFRRDLQQFLGLDTPLVDFNTIPEQNRNDEAYPEFIDLCDAKYVKIKQVLLQSGRKSSQWIIDKFLKSEDVFVGNRDYFVEHLRGWGVDPCQK